MEVSAIQSSQNSTVNDIEDKSKSNTGNSSNFKNSNYKTSNSKLVKDKNPSIIPVNYSCVSCGGNNHFRQNCRY